MSTYALIFMAGMAASWHCVGMCGGFACAIAGDRRGRVATARRQLLYNAGRVTTYCFLGALAGALAAGIGTSSPNMAITGPQRLLAIISGLLMIFIGLQFFGCFQRLKRPPMIGFGGEALTVALRDLLRSPSPFAPLAFGVANGFLPCPLVYAFLAQAAASGAPVPGITVMLAFGLGTFPAMLLMGGLSGWLWRKVAPAREPALASGAGSVDAISWGTTWQRHAGHVAGTFIVLLGMITLSRGVFSLHSLIHLI